MIRITGMVMLGFGTLLLLVATGLAAYQVEIPGADDKPVFAIDFHTQLGTTCYALLLAACFILAALGLLTLGTWPDEQKSLSMAE
ncbi:MAG TPA: hypothetical protein VG713_06990 [Pirellulales bacterium]|nr:hypothetical protein [Pirellulales bacterium]